MIPHALPLTLSLFGLVGLGQAAGSANVTSVANATSVEHVYPRSTLETRIAIVERDVECPTCHVTSSQASVTTSCTTTITAAPKTTLSFTWKPQASCTSSCTEGQDDDDDDDDDDDEDDDDEDEDEDNETSWWDYPTGSSKTTTETDTTTTTTSTTSTQLCFFYILHLVHVGFSRFSPLVTLLVIHQLCFLLQLHPNHPNLEFAFRSILQPFLQLILGLVFRIVIFIQLLFIIFRLRAHQLAQQDTYRKPFCFDCQQRFYHDDYDDRFLRLVFWSQCAVCLEHYSWFRIRWQIQFRRVYCLFLVGGSWSTASPSTESSVWETSTYSKSSKSASSSASQKTPSATSTKSASAWSSASQSTLTATNTKSRVSGSSTVTSAVPSVTPFIKVNEMAGRPSAILGGGLAAGLGAIAFFF
ncbi:hypothetical protein BJ166DRAFT_589512 [Pestalotiopsis sp. NC0098]|nr:hypothetical protein BJ166DRAFT_589512 [Pestalotiopsis sp. NC0098]